MWHLYTAKVWPVRCTRKACVHFGPHKRPVNFQRFALCRQDLRPVRALLVICNGERLYLVQAKHHSILQAMPLQTSSPAFNVQNPENLLAVYRDQNEHRHPSCKVQAKPEQSGRKIPCLNYSWSLHKLHPSMGQPMQAQLPALPMRLDCKH